MTDAPAPYHRQDLEAQLLACAFEMIRAGGVEALSLRELGRTANVSRAAPYHYFPTKQALLQRIGEIGFERLAEAIEASLGSQTDPMARALAGFGAYLAFARSEPAIFQLMFANRLARTEADSEPITEGFPFSSGAARRAFRLLAEEAGHLPDMSDRAPAEQLARAHILWAYAHGVAMLAIGENLKGSEPENLLEKGLCLLLGDLRPAAPAASAGR